MAPAADPAFDSAGQRNFCNHPTRCTAAAATDAHAKPAGR